MIRNNPLSMTPELTGYDEQLLTPEELAKWLNVKLSTVYKWVAIRYIPTVKLGGKVKGSVRFIRIEVKRWIQKRLRRGRDAYKPDVRDLMQ